MNTIMAGAYSRATGALIDTREARGRKSSSYMEEQFLLLIGHELPQQVAVGKMQKAVQQEEGEPYTVEVVTVNGVEYEAYMWVGVRYE